MGFSDPIIDPAHVDHKWSPHCQISQSLTRHKQSNRNWFWLLDPMAPPSDTATVRVLCPKLVLSGNQQPGTLQWLIGSPFFPPFTVVSTFRCIHQSPDFQLESGKKKPFSTLVLGLAHMDKWNRMFNCMVPVFDFERWIFYNCFDWCCPRVRNWEIE